MPRGFTGAASTSTVAALLVGGDGHLRAKLLVTLAAMLAVAAAAPTSAAAARSVEVTRYSLAGGCYALRSEHLDRFVTKTPQGDYRVSAAGPAGAAERFRMQATTLGQYLFYGRERDFMAVAGGPIGARTVEPTPEASRAADWRLSDAGGGAFRITNLSNGRVLAATPQGDLVSAAPSTGRAALFSFAPASGCPRYPEVQVNAVGRPTTGKSPFGRVTGLLDSHLHIGAFEFLGGRAHCGRPWHRYGAPRALVDCPDHEPNGEGAVLENALSGNPAATHDTTGWPEFTDWPDHDSLTHEQTYYKWLERAWRGGVRLIVNDATDNRVLCEIYPFKRNRCDEMANTRLQFRRVRQLQNYIDAQEGGPGRGWFRVVDDPFEARRVINQGKIAVVLGIEVSEIFGCRRFNEQPQCTREDIRQGLDRFYALGARSAFPVHKFDNALGGTRFDSGTTGAAVNAGNFYGTGRFWDIETCTGPQSDNTQSTSTPEEADIIASGLHAYAPKGAAPVYPPPPHCNTRGLSRLGAYLVRQMMRRQMIVEPDHTSVRAQNRILDILEASDYSGVVASHTWSDPAAWPRIYELGGIVTPITEETPEFIEEWETLRRVRSDRYFFGMGFGADSNGLHVQPPPREGAGANPVTYPFRSLDGSVTLHQQRSGTRVYDINTDGVDHYGLHPDWVEDLRLVAGDRIARDLSRGAEAYLQMWERTVGVEEERCRRPRARVTGTGVDGVRVGVTGPRLLRRAGQPSTRTGRAYRWCVRGQRNSTVGAAFTASGRVGVVASTAPGHEAAGVGPGDSASGGGGRLRIRPAGAGRSFVYGVAGGRVTFVALAIRQVASDRAELRRQLTYAGVR